MKFELIPILSLMEDLYSQPISPERFQAYLSKLQGGTKGDLSLPIGGFNPMAKEHVVQKIKELQAIKAEQIIQEVIDQLNTKFKNQNPRLIKIVLNLADDLKGGWTNYYTTDFDSKFKLNALVSRNFCTPHFWTSENYDKALVEKRVLEYAYRTIYWLNHPKLQTLEDHLNQEIYVSQQAKQTVKPFTPSTLNTIKTFYQENKKQDDYSILFNFFYGDQAAESLNYPCYGIKQINGFDYAQLLASAI